MSVPRFPHSGATTPTRLISPRPLQNRPERARTGRGCGCKSGGWHDQNTRPRSSAIHSSCHGPRTRNPLPGGRAKRLLVYNMAEKPFCPPARGTIVLPQSLRFVWLTSWNGWPVFPLPLYRCSPPRPIPKGPLRPGFADPLPDRMWGPWKDFVFSRKHAIGHASHNHSLKFAHDKFRRTYPNGKPHLMCYNRKNPSRIHTNDTNPH